jgi:hypothetical protein
MGLEEESSSPVDELFGSGAFLMLFVYLLSRIRQTVSPSRCWSVGWRPAPVATLADM